MGIVNGIANAMGIVVPMVVALMVDGNVSFNLLIVINLFIYKKYDRYLCLFNINCISNEI